MGTNGQPLTEEVLMGWLGSVNTLPSSGPWGQASRGKGQGGNGQSWQKEKATSKDQGPTRRKKRMCRMKKGLWEKNNNKRRKAKERKTVRDLA